MSRLTFWKTRVEKGDGKWDLINDLERLDALIKEQEIT